MLQTSLASLVPRVPDNYLTAINDLVCLEMSGIGFMTGGDFINPASLKPTLH